MDMTDEKERVALLPCPFCGGVPRHWNGGFPTFIACRKCGASVSEKENPELEAAWNRRTDSGPQDVPSSFGGATSAELFEALGKTPQEAESMERGLNAVLRRQQMIEDNSK